MAKQVTENSDARDEQSSVAIKPTAYKKLVEAVAAANAKMDTGRQNKAELIRDAVEEGLHKTAFAWAMKLRKMDPVKRNELLFHFEVYCEREKFAREDLLGDRPTARIVKPIKTESPSEAAGEDLRPRHLRQPGASAASPQAQVDKIKDDALAKIGRGNDNAKPH